MARVKVCGECGAHNQPYEPFCEVDDCGAPLADVKVVDTAELESSATEEVASGGSDTGGEPQPLVVGASARTVRDQQAAPCALLFPWGNVPVAGELGIGRETGFSSISQRLDAYPTVSRQHAVVAIAEGRWTVRDLRSTNGTYVNGDQLAEGESRPIANGDRVGFSRGLQVEVRIGPLDGAHG